MGRKSKNVVNAEINRLRRVLESTDKADFELIEELKIKRVTFYRYKNRILEQDKTAWLEVTKESLESAALKIKKKLDYAMKIYKDVADNAPDQRARIEAAKKLVECQIIFYRMLEKGPTSKTVVLPEVKGGGGEEYSTDRRMEPLGSNTVSTN